MKIVAGCIPQWQGICLAYMFPSLQKVKEINITVTKINFVKEIKVEL